MNLEYLRGVFKYRFSEANISQTFLMEVMRYETKLRDMLNNLKITPSHSSIKNQEHIFYRIPTTDYQIILWNITEMKRKQEGSIYPDKN